MNIQMYEFKIGNIEFIAGTFNGKCCIMDFKYRKSMDRLINYRLRLLNTTIEYTKNKLHEQIENELQQYFDKKRERFSFPLLMLGTEFQKKVWSELLKIPYGQTISYKDLAERIGNINAVRAVAQANGANNIGIVIPCHRVIASNGKLQGYGGGLSMKKRLLKLEKNVSTHNK